ncbi:MAG: hypothetical protein KBA61_03370 [Spirochaetes bacterium]|nr:hypothetical protein [Spirochaetota bacterium]
MNRKPRMYWTYWQHVATALEPFISEHGYLPTQRELREIGLSTLLRAFNYFGGHAMVAARLGIPTAPEHHRSRLHNWESFCNELAPLVARRGYFPTVSELVREGRHDLIAALRRYHGGATDAAQRLGIPTNTAFHGRNSAGYWTKERIIAAYRDVIRTHSLTHWPSPNDLTRLGYVALRGAMQKIGYRAVRAILTAEGITLSAKPRKLGHLVPFVQKYRLTDEIFERDELFFYFLGLVAADGSFITHRREMSVELCLKQGDLELLEHLRDRISPGRPIHQKPGKTSRYTAVRFKLNDRRLVAMLQDHIITHDKSHTLSWPDTIPEEHQPHFIRGYIDGDGTIGVALTRRTVRGKERFYPVTRLRVLGTEAFLTGMTRAIHRTQDLNPVKVRRKGKERVFEVQYSGRHAEKILDWLYDGATIFLARKRKVYLYLCTASRETLLTNYRTPAGRYNTRACQNTLIIHNKGA